MRCFVTTAANRARCQPSGDVAGARVAHAAGRSRWRQSEDVAGVQVVASPREHHDVARGPTEGS
jgi:hypothetical protein